MKTLLIVVLFFISTNTRAADQAVLTKSSESEALTILMIMCPTCVLAHLISGSSAKKKEDPKKAPDSKNKVETPIERSLASEPKKVSK